MLVKITCASCNKICEKKAYNVKRVSHSFCSIPCRKKGQILYPNRPRKGTYFKCQICKKSRYAKPSHVGLHRFCSLKCYGISQYKRININCKYCNNKFWITEGELQYKRIVGRYCSKKCYSLEMRKYMCGERSPLWKGGVSRKHNLIRKGAAWREWRKAVFERDDFTCVFCVAKNEKGKWIEIHPDHIKPFAYFPKLRFELSNGRTLCAPCHRKTPTYGTGAKLMYGKLKTLTTAV